MGHKNQLTTIIVTVDHEYVQDNENMGRLGGEKIQHKPILAK